MKRRHIFPAAGFRRGRRANVIAGGGKPVARLMRFGKPNAREIRIDDGRIWIAEDFDRFVPSGFEPYL